MNITREQTDTLQEDITIRLSPEDYKEQVNQELKKQARKASLPGFRPGKVPISVVRRMVGMSVLMEELNKTINKSLSDYLKEENLQILGDPLPKDQLPDDYFDVNCNKELEFTFEVGLAPEFEVKWPEAEETPPLYEIEIDEEFLDKQIESLRERMGENIQAEKVEKGDIIYGKLVEVDENGEALEEGFEKMVALNPARMKQPDALDVFLGQEVDATTELDLFSLGENAGEIADLLYMEAEEVEALRDKRLQFTIRRINRMKPAEMGPDFFNKVLENEEGSENWVETEEAFRQALREKIQEGLASEPTRRFSHELREKLLELNPIPLPTSFLKKWIKQSSKEEISDEKLEEEFDEYANQLRWSLILQKLEEQHPQLEVDELDLEESMREILRKSIPDMDEEMEKAYLAHSLQNEQMVRMQYDKIFEKQLSDFWLEKLQPEKQTISATEFFKPQDE
ncbi:MAG: hypothetical protein D6730_11895 [Bacteroidetes bacterium]|nr:MAG: hypothetical protein D6730_11895 [Bacteroidota bacterium]